jgi:lauroyl/myristoyl acyltransferase
MKARFLAALVIGLLPPRWSFTGLSRLCRSAAFQRMWPVRGRAGMVREFLESIRSEMNHDAAVARSLCCNYAQPWLLRGLARGAARDYERAVAVRGLPHFEHAAALNRGVIVAVSHFGIPHADLLVLTRNGRRDIVTFGSFEYELKLMGLDHLPHVPLAVERVENFVFRANFLPRAREVLAGAGVVRVAGDGLHGTGGRTWPFHGRARHFRPGIAELAVDTGAPVVPVFGVLSDAGRLEVEFLPALDPPGPAMSRRAAVDACLGQYVRLLEQRWSVDPGSVVWETARPHLEAPPQEQM